MRMAAALIGMFLSSWAMAFTPWQGQWWNPQEGGSGYNIDVQNGVLVVTVFSYKSNGESEWYLAAGPLTQGGKFFSGSLDKYRGGQCITCGYGGGPVSGGSDGTVSITFSDEMHAVLRVGGRASSIVPYRFGVEEAPGGLLGEWVFAYDIVTTWAERFRFTQIVPGTTNGSGLVYDSSRAAGCELQVRGTAAGFVFCVDLDSSGKTANQYIWKYGIDQTYEGAWISPTSGRAYDMKGTLTLWRNGQSKAIVVDDGADAGRLALKSREEASAGGKSAAWAEEEHRFAFEEVAEALRRAIR